MMMSEQPKPNKISREDLSGSTVNTAASHDGLIKPQSDPRHYRTLTLPNKLKVILVSDPTTDKAAASLSVGAGCLQDPDNLQGLAHFCEHMVFLGTKKYPVENDFDKYLSDNGGGSNAYTGDDHTNYYFDVSPDKLEHALDRFSQFFIEPLFTESSTEKEINAVNSEHEGNMEVDAWRIEQIAKTTSSPSHPYHKFGTGNLDTLWHQPREKSIDITAALMEFHSKYYSANIMTLAVLGHNSLDYLQQLVESLFSPIENKNAELMVWNDSPFTEAELKMQVNVVPVKDLRQMSIMFPFPDTSSYYMSGSDHYITHLIGHEGKGSLLSLLKKKNWVNELCADAATLSRGFGALTIELELTTIGLENAHEIVTTVFQYLEMIRNMGPQEWVWQELKDIEAMAFRFKDKSDVDDYVQYLTERMIKYPLEEVLSAGYLLTHYKPDEIKQLLEYLVPDKCRITIITNAWADKADQTEEFYGIKYSVEKLPDSVIDRWRKCGLNEELALPPPNEFIPSVFDLKQPRQDWGIHPKIVLHNELSRVWFLQDNEFLLPKAVAHVEVFSELPSKSPLNVCLNAMLTRMVQDSLNELAYNATAAGLEYSLNDTVYGIEINVSGYDHKYGILLEKICEKITNFSCEPSRFELIKETYSRYLKNWDRDKPQKLAVWYITYLLRRNRFTPMELLDELNNVTVTMLCQFAEEFVSNVKLEWLLYGNLTQTEATKLAVSCENLFRAKSQSSNSILSPDVKRLRELKLNPGADFVFTKDTVHHSDSCCTVLFQSGADEFRSNVLVELVDQIAYENCYNQLRTVEQLGYYVYTDVRKSNGTRGFQILVQSSRHPQYLESRIDHFLENLYKKIQEMSEDEFLQHRNALATRKAEKPKKITIRARLLWEEILSRQVKFNRVKMELTELEGISYSDILEFYNELIGPPGHKKRRLSIHILSKAKKGAGQRVNTELADLVRSEAIERNPEPIVDVEEWKSKHEFYPFPPEPMYKDFAAVEEQVMDMST